MGIEDEEETGCKCFASRAGGHEQRREGDTNGVSRMQLSGTKTFTESSVEGIVSGEHGGSLQEKRY